MECGVRPGPHYAQLKAGKTVELSDGRLLEPATFLGPPVPGRRLAVLGDTRDSGELAALVGEAGLDLLGRIRIRTLSAVLSVFSSASDYLPCRSVLRFTVQSW